MYLTNTNRHHLLNLIRLIALVALIVVAGHYAEARQRGPAFTDELQFAREELQRHNVLLGNLSERAEHERDATFIKNFKKSLHILDLQLQTAERSLDFARQFKQGPEARTAGAKAREHLRASLFQLQEAGDRAVHVAIEADRQPLHFRVSRTGQ